MYDIITSAGQSGAPIQRVNGSVYETVGVVTGQQTIDDENWFVGTFIT